MNGGFHAQWGGLLALLTWRVKYGWREEGWSQKVWILLWGMGLGLEWGLGLKDNVWLICLSRLRGVWNVEEMKGAMGFFCSYGFILIGKIRTLSFLAGEADRQPAKCTRLSIPLWGETMECGSCGFRVGTGVESMQKL